MLIRQIIALSAVGVIGIYIWWSKISTPWTAEDRENLRRNQMLEDDDGA